jgi:uncharacterized membrane protein YkvI
MNLLIGLVLLVLALALIGFLVHLITTKIPMDDTIKQTIVVATVIVMVIFLLLLLTGRVPLPTFPSLARG